MAVSFDAYLSRGLVTRAGTPGELGIAELQTAGFGVFGYHTVNAPYSATELPNFMYNTRVDNPTGLAWTYSPLKYWPNQDGEGADAPVDRVSFFAYAPFVYSDPDSGVPVGAQDGTAGITWISRFTDKGDPQVGYKVSFTPNECVDLCWGTPHLNVCKPSVPQTIDFTFRHSLAALNVQIDAIMDETVAPGSNPLHSDTRIYVRSVTFSGLADKGTLSLSGTSSPLWSGYVSGSALDRSPLTVHDGRLDGWESLYDDPGETTCGLNPNIVQQMGYNTKPGVTEETVNLFSGDLAAAPVFVIPNGYPLALNIVYDVETRDDKLSDSLLSDGQTHGLSTRVNIRTNITTTSGPIRLEAGKRYILRLHLGLTSVKFQAEIAVTDHWSEWTDGKESAIFNPVIIDGQGTDGNYDFEDGTGMVWG